MEELDIINFWLPIQWLTNMLNFCDRTLKRTDRGAIELLDFCYYLYFVFVTCACFVWTLILVLGISIITINAFECVSNVATLDVAFWAPSTILLHQLHARLRHSSQYSMIKSFRSSARSASFHTKHASNANVFRVILLDANSYLALWYVTCYTAKSVSANAVTIYDCHIIKIIYGMR
jgi:hypothetical protein